MVIEDPSEKSSDGMSMVWTTPLGEEESLWEDKKGKD